MKNYLEFDNEPIFESEIIEGWSDEEVAQAEKLYTELYNLYEKKGLEGLQKLEEGFLSKLVGGAAGFIVGPSIGKVIAKALGIEKGILYDMFTSRLVGTALGASITKQIGKK